MRYGSEDNGWSIPGDEAEHVRGQRLEVQGEKEEWLLIRPNE